VASAFLLALAGGGVDAGEQTVVEAVGEKEKGAVHKY
jgi:hypothetical protein